MINIGIFLEYYFTKWLFIGSTFYGVCMIVRKLMVRK